MKLPLKLRSHAIRNIKTKTEKIGWIGSVLSHWLIHTIYIFCFYSVPLLIPCNCTVRITQVLAFFIIFSELFEISKSVLYKNFWIIYINYLYSSTYVRTHAHTHTHTHTRARALIFLKNKIWKIHFNYFLKISLTRMTTNNCINFTIKPISISQIVFKM